MVLRSQDLFLNDLMRLFERTRASGSVFITMKRCEPKPSKKVDKKGAKAAEVEAEPACLIRAKYGKTRLSTMVPAKDHVRFQIQFGKVLSGHMDSLKKKEKKDKAKGSKPRAE
mmetsp:Transcript_5941/g.13515  ORF Transcript_5941/g.13515 Transcript_5941/m.13515 type:complete len:113 (-) Transcript_5941:67-405(-)